MEAEVTLTLILLTLVSFSTEQHLVENLRARNEEASNKMKINLIQVKQLGDSNAEFALDLYNQFITDTKTGKPNRT